MGRLRGLTVVLGALILWAGAAWGQSEGSGFEGSGAILRAGVEVSFFTYSPPELSLSAQVQRKDWQMGIQLTHSLDPESSAPTLTLTERVQMGAGSMQLTLSNGESGAGLNLLVLEKTPYGQANARLQVSPQGVTGALNEGSLTWSSLQVQAEQLHYTSGVFQVKKKFVLSWSPFPEVSIVLSADATGLKPLAIGIEKELQEGLKYRLTGNFDVGRERLRLQGWTVSMDWGKLGMGLELDASGAWQKLWLQGIYPLGPADFTGTLSFGPQGWMGLHLQGAFDGQRLPEPVTGKGKLDLRLGPEGLQAFHLEGLLEQWLGGGSLEGVLDAAPGNWVLALKPHLTFGLSSTLEAELKVDSTTWELYLKAQWIELLGSAGGELKWSPQGVSDLHLDGSLLLDDAMLQGNFICNGVCHEQAWMARLMGSLSLGLWETSGILDLGPGGWQSASIDLTRQVSF